MVQRMWKIAWMEEEHRRNSLLYLGTGPVKQRTKIHLTVIHLSPCVSPQQEMVIAVFCESQRERKLSKGASNCGLGEMPYKKNLCLIFPLPASIFSILVPVTKILIYS